MKQDKIIFGQEAIFTTNSDFTGVNNNALVCGGSGSGKTMSISEPLLLNTYNSSLIVTVTKRKLIDKYTPLFTKRGYEVEVLNLVHPQESTINIDPALSMKEDADAVFLANAVVRSVPNKDGSYLGEYWVNSAISLFTAEIGYCMWQYGGVHLEEALKLNDELRFFGDDNGITTLLDPMFDEMEEMVGASHFAIRCWHTFKDLPYSTAACVYSTLNSIIDTLFTTSLRKMMVTAPPLPIEEAGDKKMLIFVYTSAVNPALNCYANLLYSHMIKALFEYAESLPEGKLPVPVHMLCDDFATGSPIVNFPDYISVFREKGISATLLVQSESQLEKIYGRQNTVTIVNNCDTYVYMGGMDIATAENVCKRLGEPIEDVLNMPIGKVYVFRRGQKPIYTDRYRIRENARYRKLTKDFEERIQKNHKSA